MIKITFWNLYFRFFFKKKKKKERKKEKEKEKRNGSETNKNVFKTFQFLSKSAK